MASGGGHEPLFFCLLNPQVMGLAFFQLKPDFLFSKFSIRYKARWRPQGEATYPPITCDNSCNIFTINSSEICSPRPSTFFTIYYSTKQHATSSFTFSQRPKSKNVWFVVFQSKRPILMNLSPNNENICPIKFACLALFAFVRGCLMPFIGQLRQRVILSHF